MKNHAFFSSSLLLSLLLLACSPKDTETADSEPEQEKISLVFGALLNEPAAGAALKLLDDPGATAFPAFAELVLSQKGALVAGTMDEPLRIKINGDPASTGEYFTENSSSLMLDPGPCVLEHFSVLDVAGEILWMAPVQSEEGSSVSNLVAHPLPMEVELHSGGQQYIPVEVVWFDDRILNAYGYVFAELETSQLLEFCIFGSLCDENGRHQPYTQFQVSAWKYSGIEDDPKGPQLYGGLENELQEHVYEEQTEIASSPLCISLPDTQGEDLYYLEISLSEPEERIIRSGIISDAQVRELFEEETQLEYFHFREGNCNLPDTPELF